MRPHVRDKIKAIKVNVPLQDAILQVPTYANFVFELLRTCLLLIKEVECQ